MISSVIKTINFFDLFDRPLTQMEVWQYLDTKCEFSDIEAILNIKNIKNIPQLSTKDNYYYLVGRDRIIEERIKRVKYARRKIKKAKNIAKIFKIIPWIRMIAIGNIIGNNNLRDNSDIDLFIIADARRIWLTRFFCTSIAKVLGVRPKKNNTRDKICLSFFVSEDNLDLENLMLSDIKDIYFIYWFSGLNIIYNAENIYERLLEENNWIKKELPNWQVKKVEQNKRSKIYKKIIDLFFARFEPNFKKIQLKIMPQNMKNLMNKDKRVVINDSVLKLHVDDRRLEYYEKFKRLLR